LTHHALRAATAVFASAARAAKSTIRSNMSRRRSFSKKVRTLSLTTALVRPSRIEPVMMKKAGLADAAVAAVDEVVARAVSGRVKIMRLSARDQIEAIEAIEANGANGANDLSGQNERNGLDRRASVKIACRATTPMMMTMISTR
jgi:hypothetical protein